MDLESGTDNPCKTTLQRCFFCFEELPDFKSEAGELAKVNFKRFSESGLFRYLKIDLKPVANNEVEISHCRECGIVLETFSKSLKALEMCKMEVLESLKVIQTTLQKESQKCKETRFKSLQDLRLELVQKCVQKTSKARQFYFQDLRSSLENSQVGDADENSNIKAEPVSTSEEESDDDTYEVFDKDAPLYPNVKLECDDDSLGDGTSTPQGLEGCNQEPPMGYIINTIVDAKQTRKSKPKSSRKTSSSRQVNCLVCNKTCQNSASLKIHLRSHSGERPFKCQQCSRAFIQNSDLKRHMKVHSGDKPYKCHHCSKSFSLKFSLRYHLMKHTEEGNNSRSSHVCPTCNKVLLTKHSLIIHVRTHTGEKPFPCQECPKAFLQKCDLNRHQKTHLKNDSERKPFQCQHCGKSFGAQQKLDAHVKRHLHEKAKNRKKRKTNKDKVSNTEKENQSATLSLPIVSNNEASSVTDTPKDEPSSNSVPVANHVPKCENTFQQPLETSENDKTTGKKKTGRKEQPGGKKQYLCMQCPRAFKKKGDLVRHERIHTGAKPFMCDKCEKSFTQRSNLQTHMRKIHP